MIEPGKILQQRYRVDKQIGQGGMGSVYIATDERFGSVVAIKETLLMDDSYRKAIEREARLLNSLKHPALPRVSDHFLEDKGQFLVMEYIPGEDLGLMIGRDHQPFEVSEVLKWADQLLDALEYLHNQSIPVIHRDIKPQNLKLTPAGQIVLLDFGLAKGNPTDAGHHTAAKSIFGYSKSYASLEQIQGTGTDPRSDIYSLSATLYHLLTGRPPEDALTRAMNVLSNKPDPLVPAHQIRDQIPRGVSAVLYHCMDLNAQVRPESAKAMREMLTSYDKYEDWEVLQVSPTTVEASDLFTQKTKLMGAQTYQEGNKLTDVKTVIMPQHQSKDTVIAAGSAVGIPAGVKNRNALAAAAGVALLACGAAVGAYFYDPALFGETSEAPKTVAPAANVQTNSEPTPSVLVGSAEADASVGDNTSKIGQPGESRTADTSRSQKASPNERPNQSTTRNTDDPNDETIFVGNTKIRNGVIETPEVFIDENGVRQKIPKPMMPPINITREQLELMKPAQRQKLLKQMEQLRNLQKNRERVQPPVMPSPERP